MTYVHTAAVSSHAALRVSPRDDARQERQIATAAGASYGIAWALDNRIIFCEELDESKPGASMR